MRERLERVGRDFFEKYLDDLGDIKMVDLADPASGFAAAAQIFTSTELAEFRTGYMRAFAEAVGEETK